MQNEIEASAYRCLQLFRDLLREVDTNQSHITDQLSPLSIEDQLGRYKLWTANLGALRRGHSSLDYRLRDALFIAKNVTRLLQSLQESLTRGAQLASGSLIYDAGDNEAVESIRAISPADSSSSSSGDESINIPERTALQECYIDIVEIIDRLFKLSIAIRNPSIRTATSKALSYVEKDDLGNDTFILFEQFTIKRIQLRYPELPEHLATRLAKSISRRRRLFLYRRRHRKKLEIIEQDSHNLPIFPGAGQIVDPRTAVPHHENIPTQSEQHAPTLLSRTILSQTTATEYVPRPETPSESSSVVSVSMISGISRESEICIPPILPADGKDFECPYCFCILHGKTQRKRLWEKHVFEDLQPYVCLFEHCPIEDQLFENYAEWLDHQKWKHNLSWQCDDMIHPDIFQTQEELEQHLIAAHSEDAGSATLSQTIKRSRRPGPRLWENCPFCGYAPEGSEALAQDAFQENKINIVKLEKHVGKHVKKLATFALPWRDDVDDEAENETSNSRVARSSISSTSLEQVQDWEDSPTDRSPDLLDLSGSERDLRTDPDEINEDWDFVPRDKEQINEDPVILAFTRWFEKQQSSRQTTSLDLTTPSYPYVYAPLTTPSEIRLIRMLPDENENELRAEIFHVPLHHAPAYIYLGYVWGQISDTERLYLGRNVYSYIQLPSSNLTTALRQLLMQGIELPIWADAICINQADMDDKLSQILLMPAILARAQQTIIWLGRSSDDSDLAMGCVKRASEDGRNPMHLSPISPATSAIAFLFSRSWWTRIWAFEEIFLPDEILIQCGSISLPLQNFVEFVKNCVPGSLPSIEKTPAFHVFLHWEELKLAIEGGTCSLLRLMVFTANYLASDLRDKVYALLTLATKEDQRNIRPDYGKSIDHFYTEVMKHFIHRHGILPLYLLQKGIDKDGYSINLPSWVVDWSLHPPTYTGLAFDGVGARNTYRACGTAMSPVVRFELGDILTLEGCICATIGDVHGLPLRIGGSDYPMGLYDQAGKLMLNENRPPETSTQNVQDGFWRTIVADRMADFSNLPLVVDWYTWERWLQDPSADAELSRNLEISLAAPAFWELVKDRSRYRAFARTRGGHLCLVPIRALAGDVLALFRGGEVPFLLRRHRDTASWWTIIGEAYVHGAMNGELVEEATWEDISIR